MMNASLSAKTGDNFAVVDVGNFSELYQYTFRAEGTPLKAKGKVFLKEALGLTSAEISLNKLSPDSSIPFYHKHRLNEEIYLFIGGEGEFQVDGEIFPVAEGTVVKVNPEGERCFRNISETEDLSWIVIQSRKDSLPDKTIEDGFKVDKKVSWG